MSDEPAPDTAADTAAVYLARCLIADHGYVPGHVPEAAPLAEACDVILTGGDGVGLIIACIIDRDAAPRPANPTGVEAIGREAADRRFELPPERVDEIAAACRHHVGRVHGVRDAVTVEIWEIGAGLPGAGDRERLEAYTFRRRDHDGVNVKTYAVDSTPGRDGATFSTAGDSPRRAPWIRQVMTEPRRSRAELAAGLAARQRTASRFQTTPFATLALLLAFAVLFVVELAWTVLPAPSFGSPSLATLVSLGALERGQVEHGEWWRMLTCAFLHGSVVHLLFNSVAMYMAGGVLENLIGRAWMLALFVLGALGGSAMSMTINEDVVSVGASGAIMGLLAAGLVLSLRLPRGPARTQIMVSLGYMLVPSLLPLATGTDYGAHFGGAITGAVAGGLLLVTWPRTAAHPRGRVAATALAAAGLLFTAYGLGRVTADRDDYARLYRSADPQLVAQLVPESLMPRGPDALQRAPELLEQYPRDPRINFIVGAIAHDEERFDDARRHLEAAVAADELIALLNNADEMRARIRYVLSLTHEIGGNAPMAVAVLVPSCDVGKRHREPAVAAHYQRLCITP
jgi:rhomboid protease GluP